MMLLSMLWGLFSSQSQTPPSEVDFLAPVLAQLPWAIPCAAVLGGLVEWCRWGYSTKTHELYWHSFCEERNPPSPYAVGMALSILIMMFGLSLLGSNSSQELSNASPADIESSIHATVFLEVIVVLLLISILSAGRTETQSIGLQTENVLWQLSQGQQGFLLVFPAVLIVGNLVVAIKGDGPEHELILALQETPALSMVCSIGLIVVVAAPFYEELLFRVILQPVLQRILGSAFGMVTSSILFALLHGIEQGICLLPLALGLGYVFHRTHSYLAVVGMHSLFNGINLVVALAPQVAPGN